ncbi:MAG TPA: beta-N-acetylhexosaminidase [Candidatus Blautia avicola]|uniref:Beta-N-acetylhexosaminidase n=1 Tax=Candidatus Blautia avicola TaxID=2838483 RepID=A0A9D2QW38_9FIRM|nr:beta-N-acetylhexosaminidase [Candidatus Blautia avicola]
MNLKFNGDQDLIRSVEEGSRLLLSEKNRDQAAAMTFFLEKASEDSGSSAVKKGGTCTVRFQEPAQYFRLFNYALHHSNEDFSLEEKPYFPRRGFMLDCSRNAAANPGKLRSLVRRLAKMGMNQLFLYMEDTYEVPEHPYFGAYRGRYTREELRDLDKYCALFGVELVPCIQTLAHLHNFLRWHDSRLLRDTGDILKVGSGEVYAFIRNLLESLRSCFSTRNIHIGMDEAHMLGLGNYLRENGYEESSVLIRRHTDRVLELCQETGWTPMMWSDMYITANTGGGYYNVKASTDTSGWEKPPRELGMVYWDYYNTRKDIYHHMLRVHKALSDRVIFAGGIWNWNGISPNYGKAFCCSRLALEACRQEGIQEVFATGWMDNGAETPIDAIYPGLAVFSFLCFHEDLYEEELSAYFRDCIDAELENFLLLDMLDALFKGSGKNLTADNPSKYLLYQDPMLGIFDYHLKDTDTETYYRALADQLKVPADVPGEYQEFFRFYYYLSLVLSQKADLGVRIKTAYDAKDLSTLKEISEEVIPNLLRNLTVMHTSREALWFADAKPFGYELLDIRLGGVKTRLESCCRRLRSFLEGRVENLEELEQERLPYWELGDAAPQDPKAELRENLWDKIISGCDLVDTV